MSSGTMQRITLRVGEAEAYRAMRHLLEGSWRRYPLYQLAESVARRVGARYDGYDLETDPPMRRMRNRLDLFFEADPMQVRQIEERLAGAGLEVIPDAPRWGTV